MRKSKLSLLKEKFYYNGFGVVQLDGYGIFNYGLTLQEVEDYLRVRSNSMNIKKVLKKFWEYGRGSTGALVTLEGKVYHLVYRHDVKHWADVIFNNATFIMD